MADEVKRLDMHGLHDFSVIALSQSDAALLQAVVDAARAKRFYKIDEAIAALDARVAEKERTP